MPATAAKVVQISSAEGTWGSTGVATIKLHGITDATLRVVDQVATVPSVGWYGPSPVAVQTGQHGEWTMDMNATYEEMPRILNGMFGALNASTGASLLHSTGGTTGPYSYDYEAPIASPSVSYSYTVEYGTTGAAYRAPGSVVKHINIKGEAAGLWTMTADGFSQMVVASSSGLSSGPSANTLPDRTVNPVRMADTSLDIDVSTGTIGTTTEAATLISFELDVESNRHAKTFAGQLYPGSWGDGAYTGTLNLMVEYNSYGKALVDQLLSTAGTVSSSTAQTVKKLIRINAVQGTSMAKKAATIDFAGVLNNGAELFGDRDGNQTVALSFNGWYSTSLSHNTYSTGLSSNGNWLCMTVTHGSSTTTG